MRIVDVRTVLLTGPSTNDPYLGRTRRSAAFIEILTDTELTGLGETYAGYFIPEAVPSIVDFYRPILVGQTVDDVPALWPPGSSTPAATGRGPGSGWRSSPGSRRRSGTCAASELGVPVHELLGGRRHDSLLGYATGAGTVYPKPRLADKIDFYLGLGFRAFKIGHRRLDPRRRGVRLHRARRRGRLRGRQVRLRAAATSGRTSRSCSTATRTTCRSAGWEVPTALAVVKAVEPFDLFLFEEPLPYTNPWGYGELRGATRVPIAGGETLTGVPEWRVFAEEDAFDIAQPDAAFCGGLGEFLRIAALFEERGRKIATHAWGAGGALMQNIHAAFAAPNTVICEIPPAFGPLHSEIVGDSFVMRDGRVLPPETPGPRRPPHAGGPRPLPVRARQRRVQRGPGQGRSRTLAIQDSSAKLRVLRARPPEIAPEGHAVAPDCKARELPLGQPARRRPRWRARRRTGRAPTSPRSARRRARR